MPGKAISHLSRMSLAEFDGRQNEMKQEIDADNYGNMGNAVPTVRNADQVSKAQSSVSRPVQQKNMESLADFRSQLGLMKKNRPEDQTSNALDGISVMTPNIDAGDQLERRSVRMATAGVHETSANQAAGNM